MLGQNLEGKKLIVWRRRPGQAMSAILVGFSGEFYVLTRTKKVGGMLFSQLCFERTARFLRKLLYTNHTPEKCSF